MASLPWKINDWEKYEGAWWNPNKQGQGELLIIAPYFSSHISRKHPKKLSSTRFKANKRKYVFTQSVIKLWNSSAQDVFDAKRKNGFKKQPDKITKYSLGFNTPFQQGYDIRCKSRKHYSTLRNAHFWRAEWTNLACIRQQLSFNMANT